jgi:HSP20 family protein
MIGKSWNDGDKNIIGYRRADPLSRLQREVNKVFEGIFTGLDIDPFGRFNGDSLNTATFAPKIDYSEDSDKILLKIEVPGINPEELELSVTPKAVFIKGEKKREERTDEKAGVTRCECSYGYFERAIPLSTEIDLDKAESTFNNGVVSITLPKSDPANKSLRKLDIKVG